MYKDAFTWNVFVGCKFNCDYCKPSFQRQMRRQIHNCELCGNYIPHFHEERITKKYMDKKLQETEGDQFIWVGSSGDISFIKNEDMDLILMAIRQYPNKTFFFQTKNPSWFNNWEFPENVILGITLESNIHYSLISEAPKPRKRVVDFYFVDHPRKFITIEPVLKFNFSKFLSWIRDIRPERVYVGYDSKDCRLPEPPLGVVKELIYELRKFTKVKEKLIRKAWDEK